jgi:hexulose-6-phosphate isomerase
VDVRPSIRLSALPHSLPLAARLAVARDAGFEGIECEVGDAPAAALRDAADTIGITVHSVHCWENYGKPLSSPDPATRDAGVAATVAAIEAARILGADTMLLIPGVVGPDASYDEVHRRSRDVIRRDILPEAERRGIVLAIENVWNGFLLSPYDCAYYVGGFGSQSVRLYLDVGNIVFGRPEGWIDIAGPLIAKLHLKDLRHRHRLRRYRVVRVGEGDVHWRRVREALARSGFSGWGVMAETEAIQPFVPKHLLGKTRGLARRIGPNPALRLLETALSRRMVADSMRRFRRHIMPGETDLTASDQPLKVLV